MHYKPDTFFHFCKCLHALFGYYHEIAVSAGIDTDWHIELPKLLPATELDTVSLFGNLMENAIDECLSMPAGRRYFCLTTEIRHGNRLYIVSTNSFDGKVQKGTDGYCSTKHDRNEIGFASIATVAERCSGSEFYVGVMMKI